MKPRAVAVLALPLIVTLALAAWVLSVRDSASRPGGYCANATVVLADLFGQAETAADVGLGPLPSTRAMVARVGDVDLAPLTVETPEVIHDDVALLLQQARRDPDRSGATAEAVDRALSLVLQDYLGRCRTA